MVARALAFLAAGAVCTTAALMPASAQRMARPLVPLDVAGRADLAGDSVRAGRVPWYAPIASLAVPGLGQALLGDDRALAYFAVEAYALIEYRAQRAEGRRGRGRYREIARDVARAIYGGERPLGPFNYYESMRRFTESGAFDRVPGGDIDPEVDETTFNGSIWRLARDTYWADPDVPPPFESEAYVNAVSLYLQRAVRPEFQWSWRNAALEHDLYRTAMDRSNRAYRRARTQFGILIANHLLSMADAFATVRVRYPSTDETGNALSVTVELPWPVGR